MTIEESYQSHADHFARHLSDPQLRKLAETWLHDDTVDAWRHHRMFRAIDPLLEECPGASWLTVGDGRWGRDAKYINDRGGLALATDISDALLREGKARGLIQDYRVENAEHLSFKDSSFDFVFCKESYHHFPRPSTALYEMLRVARKAVVLVEPQDEVPLRLLSRIKILIKRLTGRAVDWRYNSFEESGNYVYTLAKREVEKIALGIGLPALAFKGINMYYIPNAEYEKVADGWRSMWRLKIMIGVQDVLAKVGLVREGLLAAVVFREMPSPSLRRRLERAGYHVRVLPPNPYLTSS